MKICIDCGETKERGEFTRHSAEVDGLRSSCRPCWRARVRAWISNNPIPHALGRCRRRAKVGGFPCTITLADLVPMPDACPVPGCGVRLARGVGKNAPSSPSVDRIIPDLGYIPGNVVWMCHACNWKKNNASAEQHEYFACIMRDAATRMREGAA